MIAKFILLIVFAAVIWYVLRVLRPKAREARLRRWEEAGLMPHQIDRYSPEHAPSEPVAPEIDGPQDPPTRS